MNRVLAIDPGPKESALVVWNGQAVEVTRFMPNEDMLYDLYKWVNEDPLFIEKVACYGMAVGEEVFETVFWTGRFVEAYGPKKVTRMPRMDAKMHLCHSSRAKDTNIRQALVDRFGEPGTKKKPGPLYGISKHLWAALAIAVTALDQMENRR
jgi:hypothetical protein